MSDHITDLEKARLDAANLRVALAEAQRHALIADVYLAHGLRPGSDTIAPDGTIARAPTKEPGA